MLNGYAKIYNQTPKPNSKTQKAKKEYVKNHPPRFVECEECHRHDVTLYKSNDKYYCKEHLPSEE